MLKQPSYIVYPLNTLQLICNQYPNGHSIYTTPQSPEQIDFSAHKSSPIEHNSLPKENSVDSEKESVDSISNSNSTTIEMPLTNNEQVTNLNKIINSLIKNNEHKEVISATKIKTNKQVRVLYGKNKTQNNDRSQYKIIHKCSLTGNDLLCADGNRCVCLLFVLLGFTHDYLSSIVFFLFCSRTARRASTPPVCRLAHSASIISM